MSQDKISLNKTDTDVPVVKKKAYTYQDFVDSFNSLDPQNMGNWPIPVKLTIYVFVFVFTMFLAYLLLISPLLGEISNANNQEQTLLTEYKEKDSKVRNLELYKAQVTQMEDTFGQLLRQLPKENEIPGLVEDINYTGVGSGVQFQDIKVEAEVTREFFIELPINIAGRGDYHAFGAFVSGLAALPRIVTVHDFEILPVPADKNKSEIPVLNMTLQARTYRYNEQADENAATAAGETATGSSTAPAASTGVAQ